MIHLCSQLDQQLVGSVTGVVVVVEVEALWFSILFLEGGDW